LRFIAEEISTNVHISLMAQYYPTTKVRDHPQLGRAILENEYNRVVEEMYSLGFQNGWTQEFDSNHFYKPDFNNKEPFS
jgi:putative pyruvate formate lyase activating enzyme